MDPCPKFQELLINKNLRASLIDLASKVSGLTVEISEGLGQSKKSPETRAHDSVPATLSDSAHNSSDVTIPSTTSSTSQIDEAEKANIDKATSMDLPAFVQNCEIVTLLPALNSLSISPPEDLVQNVGGLSHLTATVESLERLITIPPVPKPLPGNLPDRRVIFHFMRHGEGYHNIGGNPNRWKIVDPGLTPKGEWQCEQQRTVINSTTNIQQIYCSPMTRTIQTTLIAFKDAMKNSTFNGVCEDIREWGSGPSATGSPLLELKARYSDKLIFDWVRKDKWEINTERKHDKSRAKRMKDVLFNRAKLVREATRSGKGVGDGSTRFGLPGDGDYSKSKEYYVPYEIAFVSHAGFLETMLKKELGGASHCKNSPRCFHNANMKSFSFDTIKVPGGVRYKLTETEESKKRPFSSGAIGPHLDPQCNYLKRDTVADATKKTH